MEFGVWARQELGELWRGIKLHILTKTVFNSRTWGASEEAHKTRKFSCFLTDCEQKEKVLCMGKRKLTKMRAKVSWFRLNEISFFSTFASLFGFKETKKG